MSLQCNIFKLKLGRIQCTLDGESRNRAEVTGVGESSWSCGVEAWHGALGLKPKN